MRSAGFPRAVGRLVSGARSATGAAYLGLVVRGRWLVIVAFVGAGAAITVLVPASTGGGSGLGDIVPADSPAVRVEERVLREFGLPLLAGTTVVLHDPGGLEPRTRAAAAQRALSLTRASASGKGPTGPGHLMAAIPVPTGAPDSSVTYVYPSPGTSRARSVQLARQYADRLTAQQIQRDPDQQGLRTYVVGATAAQLAQSGYLGARLPWFESASVVLIVAVVALVFRSAVAPVVVLAVASLGYLVLQRVLAVLASAVGISVPDQLQPLLVALLLGVITDYCVLFFSTFRDELASGGHRLQAARRTVGRDGVMVGVAGLTVAGGTIALLAAPFELFRALGPALAVSVLIGMVVCLLLVPALMAVLGRVLFFPRHLGAPPAAHRGHGLPGPGRLVRLVTSRRGAAAAVVTCVVVLGVAAVPLGSASLGLSVTATLPDDDPVAQGVRALRDAGVRGITAPTEVLVAGHGVGGRRLDLGRLQLSLATSPGVARVAGPADSPLAAGHGVVLAPDGDAARYLLVLDSDPLGARAIRQVRSLRHALPGLARRAGLSDVDVGVTGQTVIAGEVTRLTRRSLEATLLAALAVELVILVVYLRALVAPVALLACSALGVAASLGLTTALFEGLLGQPGLTFYAPFTSAVLLLALGSDYNVFAVGTIWEQAAHRPLGQAIAVAVPRTARAITAAGVILASTFALVAVIPLTTFHQIAFTMSVGLLLDTLVVRPVLTPAVLVLLGPAGGWPGTRTRTPRTLRTPRTTPS